MPQDDTAVEVDTQAAAAAVDRAASTIRRWASEGRLTQRGQRGRRKLYDLAEVYRLDASLRKDGR